MYNQGKDHYEITVDVKQDFEHLNGDYEISVYSADINSMKPDQWQIGKIALWFKNGVDEGSNNGIRSEYQPKGIINHIFGPQQ